MNREFLKELELEKDVIDKIMAEHGKAVNDIKEKADKVDSLESQIEDYKTQLSDRDKQLEELKEQAKGNEELQGKIKELQDENENVKKEYESQLQEQQKEFAIKSALQNDEVHDVDIAIKALDLESINYKDGKLIGYDEQRDSLKENKAFLFKQDEPEEPKPNFTKGEHDRPDNNNNPIAAKLAKYQK